MLIQELKDFFSKQDYKLIIAADGEPRVTVFNTDNGVTSEIPAGGVAVELDPIARALNATYIARAKNEQEKKVLDSNNKLLISEGGESYVLKRLFFNDKDVDDYYFGFSNQTLWPLCHVAFEEPLLNKEWFEGYKKVNQKFAEAIRQEINSKKTFIWLHDYQLAMVPYYLRKYNLPKETVIGMFWHIPWPTWEVFRILPYKKDILESMLSCDFLGFHRGYQAQNFLSTVNREFETRIDQERQSIHYNNNVTTVKNLPLGIDVDVVKALVHKEEEETLLGKVIREMLGIEEQKPHPMDWYFDKYKVIFGVDRLDYTKGIRHRLSALDKFFEKNPSYIGKAVYLGIIAPSREAISSYKRVREDTKRLSSAINAKYGTKEWKPIHLIHESFKREDIINFYHKADICLVTPLDDGMNLVSKEFIIASSLSDNPGMLVLSQFAGSSIDLSQALIVNPYDIDEVADAVKAGLRMSREEKIKRIKDMTAMLDDKNVYQWSYDFVKQALEASK